jgi:hypothetical protein
MVLLVMLTTPPELKRPPPLPAKMALLTVLPEMVLLLMVSVPKLLKMPPPLVAVLPETVALLRVSVPRLEMPPPLETIPLAIVRPEMVTLTPCSALTRRSSG